MTDYLYIFYDICVAGIILIALYQGSKRGFLRSAVYAILIVAAFFISWFGAEALSPLIYDSFIHETVIDTLTETASEKNPVTVVSNALTSGDYGTTVSDGEISELISGASDIFNELAETLRENGSQDSKTTIATGVESSVTSEVKSFLFSDYIINALETLGAATGDMSEVVNVFLTGSAEETAATAEAEIVRPIIEMALKIVVFLVLLFVLRLVIDPVSNLFKFANKIPIIGSVNVLLGAVLGAVEGLITVYGLALLLRLIVNVSGDSLIFLNTDTIELTYIFKYFYELNLMG
ncbi:MAG: CvpA family protein [Oscillospiraceae bacterium]|nr:CvpA family protein [Oscillospiraceae bacterium]